MGRGSLILTLRWQGTSKLEPKGSEKGSHQPPLPQSSAPWDFKTGAKERSSRYLQMPGWRMCTIFFCGCLAFATLHIVRLISWCWGMCTKDVQKLPLVKASQRWLWSRRLSQVPGQCLATDVGILGRLSLLGTRGWWKSCLGYLWNTSWDGATRCRLPRRGTCTAELLRECIACHGSRQGAAHLEQPQLSLSQPRCPPARTSGM